MNKQFFIRNTLSIVTAVLTCGISLNGAVYAQQGDEALEEITVTGSRIARRDFTSQSPIVTIESETFFDRVNIGLEATLNQMPQFTVRGTSAETSPAGTPFPQATAAPGAATADLRGLETFRTLILVDGRRVQPVNGSLVVDLNTIPSAAIANVEVITGGAAAVYGADAISGVINLKLKRDFEGMEFNAQYGVSEEGDGEEMQFSALIGANLADGRGNVMLGANYADRNIILGKDRDWVRAGWEDPNTQGGGIGSSNLSQYATGNASYCAVTNCGQPVFPAPPNVPAAGFPLIGANYVIDQNGNVFDSSDPLNPANPYTGPLGGDSGFKINPDGTLGYDEIERNYIQLPFERYSIFGSAHFDVTEHVEIFADVRYSETFAESKGFTSGVFNVWSPTVPYNPLYDDPTSPTFRQNPTGIHHPVPPALAALLNSRPDPDAPWTYVGGLDYLGNFTTSTTSNVYQVIGGFRGDIPVDSDLMDDWTWEIYASHGKTNINAFQPEGFPHLGRVQNLFNADDYGHQFDISTLPGFFPLAVTGHCTTGLPIFNPDGSVDDRPRVSKDCSDYVVLRMNNATTLTQDIIEGSVQGSLYELPAGSLQFALGGTFREENFRFDPDSGYNANQDFPNVVQNIILPVSVDGTTNVKEIFAELAIPIVRDLPFVKSFEIDPGVRYSDYNTSGGVETYKVLGDWTVNDWVRFRGGYQVANRAPNVAELFTPAGGSSLEVGTDACTSHSQVQSWGNVSGNPNRENVQILCAELMQRDGAPLSIYDPSLPGTGNPFSGSADDYLFNVFGATFFFPFTIGITQGNTDLRSESADTFTAGVVLDSPFEHPALEQMTVSVDWFRIEVTDAIDIPGANTVYQQCLDASFNSLVGSPAGSVTGAEMAANNPFCALIQREYIGGAPYAPGNHGAARKYKAQFLNQGGLNTEGIDIQFNWGFDFSDMDVEMIPGTFSVNVLASMLESYAVAPFPGADFIEYAGTTVNSSFNYRTLTTFNYSNGSWSIGLRWQHLPSLDVAPDAAADAFGVASHDQIDLFGRWSIGETYQLRFGIDNLWNTDPEVVGASESDHNLGSTNSNYDQIGRRFFVGLQANF